MSATAVPGRAHVLIAAERLPTRVGLRLALEPEARCTEAADAESAVDAAVRDRPDVCLLGLDPGGQGLRVVSEIVSKVPSATVILLTSKLDEEEFMAAVRAGASGYLTNSLDPARLTVVEDLEAGLDAALADGSGPLYALPTYTALLDLRELLARRGQAQEYWR